jgi:hypothetical protein
VEPRQVIPEPHEASVETFRVEVGEAEEDVLLEVDVVDVLEEVLDVVGFEELEELVDVFELVEVFDDDVEDDEQTPNAGWQPVPQYALVVPHQPY